MARQALGRGLKTLIPTAKSAPTPPPAANTAPATPAPQIPVAAIDESPWQPRRRFDEESLRELAVSIRENGLIQPLVVRPRGERFELIAGERRLRAVRELGWVEVPAVRTDATDRQAREWALVENLQRDDLTPIEIALAYQSLQQDLGLTHEHISARLGVSRSNVTNLLRLLTLPEEVKAMIAEEDLSMGHARALLSLPDALSQIRLARKIVQQGLAVREVERLTQEGKGKRKPKAASASPTPKADPHIRDTEERLARHLGTRVQILDQDGKGRIVIHYDSHMDANRILERVGLNRDE